MESLKIMLLAFVIYLFGFALSDGNPSSCATIYKQGGAPAIFQAPECRNWILSKGFSDNQTDSNCYWGTGTNRKPKIPVDDHVLCDLNMQIPFYAQNNSKDARFGMVAVFDQYEHEKLSKTASKVLKEFFLFHVYFVWNDTYTSDKCGEVPCKNEELLLQNPEVNGFDGTSSWEFDHTTFKIILREALLRTVRDLSSTFAAGIDHNNLVLGCPTIVILAKGEVLIVNACNSRAFLCAAQPWRSKRGDFRINYSAKELTRGVSVKEDETPDWCTPTQLHNRPFPRRSNSSLYVRRYGDVGAVSVTDWQALSDQDLFLVVATSSIFEWLTGLDACNLIYDRCRYSDFRTTVSTACLYRISYADCIVDMSFLAGNHDGIAVVIHLESAGFLTRDPVLRYNDILSWRYPGYFK